MDVIDSVLFSPFASKKYCNLFYGFEIYYVITFTIALIAGVVAMIQNKMDTSYYIVLVVGLIMKFLFYMQNRILYSMCYEDLTLA